MYLIFIRVFVMLYIIITTIMFWRAISSFIFNKNIQIKELLLIPFWPIMVLSENGSKKLANALGARSINEK